MIFSQWFHTKKERVRKIIFFQEFEISRNIPSTDFQLTCEFPFQRRTSVQSEKKKRSASSRLINQRLGRDFTRILCLRTPGVTVTRNRYFLLFIFCSYKIQSDPSRARLDQKIKHRNRLFHRVSQQEHQQNLQQQNSHHHHQQHPHQQQQLHHHYSPNNQRPPHPKTLNNHQSAKKQSPPKVPSSTSSPIQLPTPTPSSRPSVTSPQPQKTAQSPPEVSRSNLTPQEVTPPPPQLQRSIISQKSQPPLASAVPKEEPKNTSEAKTEDMPQVQSQQQPTSAPKSPVHPKSGTRQQPVSPFRPQHPNFHSSTPPSLRPPILR